MWVWTVDAAVLGDLWMHWGLVGLLMGGGEGELGVGGRK